MPLKQMVWPLLITGTVGLSIAAFGMLASILFDIDLDRINAAGKHDSGLAVTILFAWFIGFTSFGLAVVANAFKEPNTECSEK